MRQWPHLAPASWGLVGSQDSKQERDCKTDDSNHTTVRNLLLANDSFQQRSLPFLFLFPPDPSGNANTQSPVYPESGIHALACPQSVGQDTSIEVLTQPAVKRGNQERNEGD